MVSIKAIYLGDLRLGLGLDRHNFWSVKTLRVDFIKKFLLGMTSDN